ncbi:MAG: hypothetical protein Q9227_002727 [Pyrenula ochraceoflavens]
MSRTHRLQVLPGHPEDTETSDSEHVPQTFYDDDETDLHPWRSLSEAQRRPSHYQEGANLTEINAPPPFSRRYSKNSSLESEQRRASLQPTRTPSRHQAFLTEIAAPPPFSRWSDAGTQTNGVPKPGRSGPGNHHHSRLATELYTVSYLIFFSLLGTLARLGIEAITFYPGAPVTTSVLWANLGGSFFMGFLSEDQQIFREEWGGYKGENSFSSLKQNSEPARAGAKKKHSSVKKTIPLYIGLATGFCGSFTSFSSFIRDIFLEVINMPHVPTMSPSAASTGPRNGGYSFEAAIGVLLIEVLVSIGALQGGAQFALGVDRFMPTVPFIFLRRVVDPLIVFVGFGCWIGAVMLSIWPPHDYWRPRAVFALVFAPAGCLLRFYASKYLNGRIPAFPLGTFFSNVCGTMVLAMSYDLQHDASLASVTGYKAETDNKKLQFIKPDSAVRRNQFSIIKILGLRLNDNKA